MNPPPLKEWYCHVESHGVHKTAYYLPQESQAHLEVLKDYWADPSPTLATVRQHAWGGSVKHCHIESLDKTLYFKRFSIRNPRYFHKLARARATVNTEAALIGLGFKTAPIIGLIEKRVAGILIDSALVTDELLGALPMFKWLNAQKDRRELEQHERIALITRAAQSVGDWHNANLFHGDMHAGNILCTMDDTIGIEIYWLDNEEGKRYSTLPHAKRLHDLAHIARFSVSVSKEEQTLFWNTYTERCSIQGEAKQRLTQAIRKKSNRHWKRKNIDYSFD